MNRFLALLLFVCLAAIHGATPAVKMTPGKTGQSDTAIEQAIRARFAKSKISADHFTVHVQGGIATIEGKTEVIQHKGTATRIAHACGAQVVNRIQISEAARLKAAARLAKARGVGTGEIKKAVVVP